MQIIHKRKGEVAETKDGKTVKEQPEAILVLLFDMSAGGSSQNNTFLGGLLDTESEMVNINLRDLLATADFTEYWEYKGSLTTPPCTEGITWIINKSI